MFGHGPPNRTSRSNPRTRPRTALLTDMKVDWANAASNGLGAKHVAINVRDIHFHTLGSGCFDPQCKDVLHFD